MSEGSLALASSPEGALAGANAGAKALLLRAATAAEVIAMAKAVPRSVILVAEVAGADADVLRQLAGQVDAAIAPSSLCSEKGFASLVAELDP